MLSIQTIAWMAIGLLALSHWMQVYKIWKHHEVRDLSAGTYAFLLIGYLILAFKATSDYLFGASEWFWIARQCASIIPVTIVLFQIIKYKRERWHDDSDPFCKNCKNELEPDWKYCPFCSYWAEEEELP